MQCSIHSSILNSISAGQAPISCRKDTRNTLKVHLDSLDMPMHRISPSTILKLLRRRRCSVLHRRRHILRNMQISILNTLNMLL